MITLIKSELSRYSEKGKNLILGMLIVIFTGFIFPQLAYPFYLLLPHNDMHIMRTLVSTSLHILFWILSNLFLNFLYTQKIPYFEQYRVSNSTPWPWEKDPAAFYSNRFKIWTNLLINNLIILPLIIANDVRVGNSLMRTEPSEFPGGFEILSHLVFFMLAEDTTFYWGHRLCHTGFMYKYIHKKHHEFKTTVGIASTYASHFEFALFNVVPCGVGPALLGSRVHMFTNYMWTIARIIETSDGHSGYDIPWSPFRLLPLSGSSSHHDFHHSHVNGNFSSFFTIWDRICGTDQSYKKFCEKTKVN
jgi:methylsterol monooxygenase/4-alpha-methyl-delta7-sterol-4alpha-methyl oxidase